MIKLIPTSSIEQLNLLKDNSTRHQVLDRLLTHPNFKFRVEHETVSKSSGIVTYVTVNDNVRYYFIQMSDTECIPYNPNEPYIFKDSRGYTVFVYFELVD